jgi:hypothetical protein
LLDTVQEISRKSGWSIEEVECLGAASEDDFHDLFLNYEGDDLDKLIRTVLQFTNFEPNTNIGENAKNALIRIGKLSELNAMRVKKHGIIIDHTESN